VLACDGIGEFFGLGFENSNVVVSGWKRMDNTVTVKLVTL
jgi:hypothetical protein